MVSVKDSHTGSSSKELLDVDRWLEAISSHYSPEFLDVIKRAALFAQSAHEGQRRISGEPYFQHAIAVADILASLRMDHETVAAAMLHDVAEDTEFSLQDIEAQFGSVIASLVDGVTKMRVIQSFKEPDDRSKKVRAQAESLRKMLLAMVEDVRVVLIKLADRTHNMRTLAALPSAKQQSIAQETIDIYAPLANRLGFWQIKWELEDLSLRYLQPGLYKKIAKMLDERRTDREGYIKSFLETLRQELTKVGIHSELSGRPKHIYSICRKMQRKQIGYHQIYDTRAVRILVQTIPECYAALGIVHSLWNHIPGEFDDYIATPKENNYQSIHTAIFGPLGKVVEVQIRTQEMHQNNELGVAAHWRYKEGGEHDANFERKIAWLRQLLEWKDDVADASEFVDHFKADVFEDRIYVFTPGGKVIDLPVGATPLDFAYHVHTEVGHRCRGAKVNGRMVALSYKLKTGEQVAILTIKRGEPSRDWLNKDLGYLYTSRARSKVQHWFKLQHHDSNAAAGRAIVEKELQRLGLNDIAFETLSRKFSFNKVDDFFAALGRGDLKITQVIRRVQEGLPQPDLAIEQLLSRGRSSQELGEGIQISGVGDLLTQIARCCKPVPGDEISGYITRGRGVTVHRQDCANILRFREKSPERLIDVAWGEQSEQSYPVDVQITAFDRQGLLRDISAVLANEHVNILAVNTSSDTKTHLANMTLTMEIHDLDKLSRTLMLINQLSNVLEVRRRR